jgi:hypothetical protein
MSCFMRTKAKKKLHVCERSRVLSKIDTPVHLKYRDKGGGKRYIRK